MYQLSISMENMNEPQSAQVTEAVQRRNAVGLCNILFHLSCARSRDKCIFHPNSKSHHYLSDDTGLEISAFSSASVHHEKNPPLAWYKPCIRDGKP